MGNPHDTLFHFTFQHAAHAAAWLRCILPAGLAQHLRWPSLRPVPERVHGRALRLGFTDVVFSIKFVAARGRAFVLSEHRSHDDPLLHATMVRYSVHLAHSLRREQSTPPMPVISIVLYHGPGPLTVGDPPIAPLAAVAADAAGLLHSLQPRMAPIIDDLSLVTEDDLMRRELTPLARLTLLALRFLPGLDPEQTIATLHRWGPLLHAVDTSDGPPVGREAIENLGWYVLHVTEAEPKDVHMAIQQHLQRPEEKIMTTAQRLLREGEARGEVRGRTNTLRQQLARRFGPLPPSIEARLDSATMPDLTRWTDRILDAPTLDTVFATD